MAGLERTLNLVLKANASDAVHAFKDVATESGKTAKETTKHSSGIAKAFKSTAAAALPVVGAAFAIGGAAIEMGDKWELAHAKLTAGLTATGTSFAAVKSQVDKLTKSAVDFGFNATDVEGTLGQMTIGLGDVHKAMGAFGVVEDLAAAKGISLQEAGLSVTKAMEGNLKPLKALGIDLSTAAGGAVKTAKAMHALADAQTKQKTTLAAVHAGLIKGPAALKAIAKANEAVYVAQSKLNTVSAAGGNILAGLGKAVSGQAAAAADTFAGKQKKLKAQFDNLLITIGPKLIPIIEKLADIFTNKIVPAIDTLVGWLEKNKGVAIALGVVLGVLAIAALAVAHPFILAAAAIAGIVAGLVYAYDNFKTFRVVVRDTVEWISKNFPIFVQGLKDEFHAIATGVAAFVDFFKAIWKRWGDGITNVVTGVWTFISGYIQSSLEIIRGIIKIFTSLIHGDWSGVWDGMKQVFGGFWDYIVSTLSGIGQIIVGVFQGIWDTIGGIISGFFDFGKQIVQAIIDGITSLAGDVGGAIKNVINSIPGASIITSHIPGFAAGGVVPGAIGAPQLAVVHGGERVIPVSGNGGGAGSGSVVINISVAGGNPRDTINQLALELRRGGARELQRALGVA